MTVRVLYVAAAMAASFVHPGRAETYTVNSTADGGGSCIAGSQTCTLRAAIQAANASSPGTVVVPAGTYLLSQPTTCAIRTNGDSTIRPASIVALCITGNVTVQGSGAGSTIIDAQQLDRVLVVTADGTAWINGVTLQNGSMNAGSSPTGGNGGGGAINNQGSLALSSCSLLTNTSLLDGGAIWSAGALTVTGCTVSNNTALFNQSGGGGIFAAYGTANIAYSTIHANASEAIGGGVATHAAAASIVASTLDSNLSAQGGGVYVDTQGSMNLTNVTISGNTAGNAGGGVNSPGTLTANNVTIAFNNSQNVVGGVIVGGSVTFGNSLVWGNTATNLIADVDCLGDPIVSRGYNLIPASTWCSLTGDQTGNLIGVDPMLSALQNNGGSTSTIAFAATSPLLDGGSPVWKST
jgi:CSLREA domain-containing protein